jgi:hypothetical protein
MAMPTLNLTDEQVIELVRQLPAEKQVALLQSLLAQRRAWREKLAHQMEERLRVLAAERGRNWDAMIDPEREDFIDDLVHEDRPCSR